MGVRIIHDLDDLADDLETVARTFKRRIAPHVRDVAQDAQRWARRDAKRTAGEHGVHYPKSITAERRGILEWEYGPDPSMDQGGMDFENGSGKQTTPHKNLAKSTDVHGAGDLARRARRELDRMFWP